jgi:iron complex outermembrane receptor protein
LAGFGGPSIDDNVRCAAGVANCTGLAPTFVIVGNPNLEPEKSTSSTRGVVWDITPKSSVTLDVWQIKRKGLVVNENTQTAVDAGRVVRDPATSTGPLDPGAILTVLVSYENSAESLTRGVDLETKHRWDLGGGMGRVTGTATWSHLLVQRVTERGGLVHNYAGTHGNCDITNCMGSPRDRVSLSLTWDMDKFRLGSNINYRGTMSNKLEQSEVGCEQTLANGADYPSGCKVKAFTTVDLSGAWKFGPNTELFGSIQNVFDAKPPSDFLTYGVIRYNPLDYAGAIGRLVRIGLKHAF